MKHMPRWISLVLCGVIVNSCGVGIPVQVRVDEFTVAVDLDEVANTAFGELGAQGLFPAETIALPLTWPAELPELNYTTSFKAPPVRVDLTPEEGTAGSEKYADINKAGEAITRIELNRIVVRLERNDLTIDLPELRLQAADDAEADPTDRMAWRTLGVISPTPAGFVGDKELEFLPGGESFLNGQLTDERKEFALRVSGRVRLQAAAGDPLPRGRAVVRMIVVATFFVDPKGVL